LNQINWYLGIVVLCIFFHETTYFIRFVFCRSFLVPIFYSYFCANMFDVRFQVTLLEWKKKIWPKRSNFWLFHLFPLLLVIHETIHKSESIRIWMLEQDQLQREDRMIGVSLTNVGFEVHHFFFLKIINNFNLLQTDLNFAWVLFFYPLQSLKEWKNVSFFSFLAVNF